MERATMNIYQIPYEERVEDVTEEHDMATLPKTRMMSKEQGMNPTDSEKRVMEKHDELTDSLE